MVDDVVEKKKKKMVVLPLLLLYDNWAGISILLPDIPFSLPMKRYQFQKMNLE